MAKKDVHEAIDATMVPNGVKAINADSVRNLLHMMTDNAGEGGGGDGGVKVYALMPDVIRDMTGEANLEFTPESWAEIKAMVEEVNPGFIPPESDAAMEEAFAANAEAYKTMMQKVKDGVSTYAVIDFGKLFGEFIVIDMPEYAGMIDCSAGVLASVGASNIAGLEQIVQFSPSNLGVFLDNPAYDNLVLVLLPNGGYIWDDMSGTSADYSLNIPVEGATLPKGYYKVENLLVRNAGYYAVGKSISIWHIDPSASAGTAVTIAGRYLIHEVIYLEGFLYFDGLELKKCMIDEEGNATIAVVGSLNAPTA